MSEISKEQEDRFLQYNKIYDAVNQILDQEVSESILKVYGLKHRVQPTEEQFNSLKSYMETFREEEHRGCLRTLLIATKPYRSVEQIEEIYEHISAKLREGSSTGKI